MFLRKIAAPSARVLSTSSSAYKRTPTLQKGLNLNLRNLHLKEKLITTEKSLAVLLIGTLALMLPPPYSSLEGVDEVDCLNNFEEPFDSH